MSVVVVLVILCGLAIVLVVITRLFVAVLLSVEGWLYYQLCTRQNISSKHILYV